MRLVKCICGSTFTPGHGNQKYCSDECVHEVEHTRKRRCENEQGRANCVDCGDPLSAGSRWEGYRRCVICHELNIAEPVDRRARQIEKWWAEGLAMREIAARLGLSMGHLSNQMCRLRAKGYQLPYRRANTTPKFPEQVAGA